MKTIKGYNQGRQDALKEEIEELEFLRTKIIEIGNHLSKMDCECCERKDRDKIILANAIDERISQIKEELK